MQAAVTLDQKFPAREFSRVFVCKRRQQLGDSDAEHECDDRNEAGRHVTPSCFVVRQHLARDGEFEPLKLRSKRVLGLISTRAKLSQAQTNFRKDGIHTRMLARRLTFGSSWVVWFSVLV